MADGTTPRLALPLIVDAFAGGGGASTGLAWALGRDPHIAINHSPAAIAMHRANHPRTQHFLCDVWEVSPREAVGAHDYIILWASPDCTHFSRAGGGKPKERKRRALASLVIRWAREVKPAVIFLENVEEFLTWGPLDNEGRPIKAKAGRSFRCWLGKLKAQGYQVEWRVLCAADYGAPTTRRRLFLVARRDGQPIRWPVPTHAKDGRGGLMPWRGAHEVIDWSLPCPSIFDRAKPLKPKTMARIAAGLRRYVLESAQPFVVPLTHGGGLDRARGVADPLPTITAANRGELALVAPTLVAGYGERPGQAPRAARADAPLGTVVGDAKHALVTAWLAKHYGGVVGQQCSLPLGTVTTQDHHSLCTATLAPAVPDRRARVRAFLIAYYGSAEREQTQQQSLFAPLATVTTRDRFGLVTVNGVDYEIADIGMRMLQPHELFAAQGFPADYVLAPELNGKRLNKTQQIELAGNSVVPQLAEAIVRANLGDAAQAAA